MKQQRSRRNQIALYALVALVLAWTLIPVFWMMLTSFKPPDAIVSTTPEVFFAPTFEHYVGLFTGGNNLWPFIRNSLLAAGISTIVAVALGTMAGYGLSRIEFAGKQHISFWIISTRMAPIAAVLLPLFLMFRFAGLLDTIWGLVVAYLTFNLPFAIWIMNAFFSGLPESLEEAAYVDGATKGQAFRRIAVPLTAPGIVTTAILCLVFSWNDYAFAQTFAGPDSQTLPTAAALLITQTGIDWGQVTAVGTIVVLPMMIIGLAVRRWLVTGLTLGAVK